MIKDLIRIKDKVEHILDKYPNTRDCDKTLWLAYLAIFHNLKNNLDNSDNPYKEFKSILLNKNTPTMESVRRVRQKFQENGLYTGTKRKQKLEESNLVREWAITT